MSYKRDPKHRIMSVRLPIEVYQTLKHPNELLL